MTRWNRFLGLLSLPRTFHTRDNNRIPILCVGRLRWILQVNFRAYWLKRFCPSCPALSPTSLSLSPSFRLSLSFRLSFLPSVRPSPSCNNTFVGRRTQKESSLPAVTVRILCSRDLARICIRANYLSLVRDLPSSNMLEAAISVSSFRTPIHHFGRPCWRRHGSGRVWLGEWIIFLRPQGAFPPGFYPLSRGVGLIARRLRRP